MGYHSAVLLKPTFFLAGFLLTLPAVSQQAAEPSSNHPQVKVNLLNVCTPSAEELCSLRGPQIAQIVRGETDQLSDGERNEILQSRI